MRLTRSPVWTLLLLAPVLPAQAYTPFGDGCAGIAGVPTLIAEPGPMGSPGSLPRINKTFTLEISNLPSSPAGIVFVIFGFSNTDWAGIPLPADLSPFGLFGCTLYSSVDAVLPAMRATVGATRAKLSIEIANDLTLVGQRFYNQGLVFETSANPFGAVVTNAAEGIIGPENKQIIEDFADETDMDRDHSSGTWGVSTDPDGEGVFGPIGGDGSHGEFSLSYLKAVPSEMVDGVRFAVFEMDTGQTVIPGNRTTSGDDEVVTDGVFNFSKFMLPRGTMLRIVGRSAPQFHVQGTVDVRGIINLRGEGLRSSSDSPSIARNETGQPGGKGGAGGGDGGAGGDKPDGLGPQARFNGQGGEDGSVVAGHAYAATAENTGGKGSRMHPGNGLRASVQFNSFQTGMVAAGGGGAGHISPGANGVALKTIPSGPGDLGPDGQGGEGYPALVPVPPGSLSHEHFLIGGGGGGGGGGHPLFAFQNVKWKSGAGGAGGGGAILLTAGHRLALDLDGQILASGGSGGAYNLIVGFAPPSPGGGGAGGAIVLQSANTGEDADGTRFVDLAGFMDVRGGAGGTGQTMALSPTSPPGVELEGGDGSHGLIRLETPLPHPGLGRVEPPAGPYRTGELVDIDPRVGFQSRWLDTGEFFSPDFLYYVLEAEVDGVPVTYSDDQTRFSGTRLAGPGEPLVVRVQGAIIDLSTGDPHPQTIRPWRLFVGDQGTSSGQLGLIDDAPTGFRFQIVLDRTVLGSAAEVVVKKLTIAF